MKTQLFSILFISLMYFSFSHNNTSYAAYSPNLSDNIIPTYTHVDVVLEMDWSESEKNENVNVFVKKNNNTPVSIIILREGQNNCEILIIPGVVIKIFNHNTGKLLKTFRAVK